MNIELLKGAMIHQTVQVTSIKEPDQRTASSFIALTMRDRCFNMRRMMSYLRKVNILFLVLMWIMKPPDIISFSDNRMLTVWE